MRFNSRIKTLVLAFFTVLLISSAASVTSEFTTDLPDTQQVDEDFTISGEVRQDYSWEQDFESILIQSSPEGSSTWFVEEEKDVGCFGSSCTISSDTISHGTAEDVEYRIVALNNAGTTVPYNPNTETVEFVEETEPVAELLNVGASDYSVSESDGSTTLQADVRNNRGSSSYVHVVWKANGQEIEDKYSFVSSNSEETISTDVSYDELSDQLDKDTEYDLTVELDYRDVNEEKTAPENLVVESQEQEERWVQFQNMPDSYEEEGSHTIEAKAHDSEARLWNTEFQLEYRKDGGWNEIDSKFCFPAGTTHECTVSGNFEPQSSGEYNLKAEITTQDGETLSEERTVDVQATDTAPVAQLNEVYASDYSVSESDGSTTLQADVRNNRGSSSYVHVIWKANGQEIEDKYSFVSSNSEETVSTDVSYDELSDQLDKDTEYDLKAELDYRDVNEEKTAPEKLVVESTESTEPVAQLNNVYASDYSVSESDGSTTFKADVRNNRGSSSYVHVTWKADGEVIEDRYSFVSSNSEETISTQVSYSDLSDQFDEDTEYELTAVLDYRDVNEEKSASENLVIESRQTTEPVAELKSVSTTNYRITQSEGSTTLRAEVKNNRDSSSYVHVKWKVDGNEIEDRYSFISANSRETVSREITYSELEDEGLNTGTEYTLKGNLQYRDVDVTKKASSKLYLVPETPEKRLEISNVRSTDTNVNEGEATQFKADLSANEDIGYLDVKFFVDNERISTKQVTNLDEGETRTVLTTTRWEDLESRLDTGKNHDLKVEASNYRIDESKTKRNAFYLNKRTERSPTARFSWDKHPARTGENVRFDASGSTDPDGDIEQYRWSFDDGSGYKYGRIKDHSFGTRGTYDVTLRVRDSQGNTDTRTREVEVVRDLGDCSVNVGRLRLGESVIDEGDSTTASVDVTNDGENQDVRVRFKVGGNTVKTVNREVSSNSQSTFQASVSPDRDRIITAQVTTQGSPCGDRTYERYQQLSVVEGGDDGEDKGERPEASFSWNPSQPEIDETVNFDASGSTDSDGDIVEYKWFFGDGSTPGYGRTVQHSYGTRGDYDVQLVVEDSEGNTDSETVTLPVSDDPGACSVRVGGINFEEAIINQGESTRASVSVSNLGDSQRFQIEFRSEGEVLDTREVQIGSNSQRTFSTTISPERDRIITADVSTQGEPCGYKDYERHRELVVLERPDEQSTLDVNVRNEDGMRLSNARVSIQGEGTETTRYTGYQGETFFELDSGSYDVVVSRSGYQTEVRNIDLSSGSDRTMTVTLGRRDSGQGTLTALVEDGEGNRLRDAEITVENGVTKYRDTDSNGRATVNLDEGTYSVTAEKTGYGSWTEQVNIDRGEDTTRVFRLTGDQREGLHIADVDYSSSVCRGSTLRADVTIENNEGYHEFVSLTGKGLGSINAVSRFSLDAGETVTKTVHFTNVQGTGNEQFTVTVNNDDSDSTTRTVDVESCGTTARGEPTDISMQMTYTKQPNMAVAGDILKVEGFVDGANGRSTVDIDIDGETKASVRTQPDGYYRTWITADEVGAKTVTASTGDVTASRPLRVIPTSRVTNLEAPVSIFEGQTYQVCARVESQIEPEVILERDGEVVNSKTANGRVCFEQQARDPGMHKYRIAALTSGEGNTASSTVEVLEQDVEASSFPGQIASVESGSGMVRVDLYNTNDNQTRYDLDLEGLPSTWTSQSEKQVILDKGERRTVYFYLTPQDEGSYEPTISVTSRGSEIYREKLDVITGGTTESRPRERSFFGGLAEGIRGLFTF